MTHKRIAIVHGYFLGDSGSAIYVRELARELVREGHEVTLVCQETAAGEHDFIDSCFELDDPNRRLEKLYGRDPGREGSCRLVRPNLAGRLLTYVAGPFTGFEAVPFQDAPDEWIEEYTERNIVALKTIFSRWRPDFVQANHLVMQPYIVREALQGSAPYVTTIHGSALNFTVKADKRMVPYAIAGLEGSVAVGTLSDTSREDLTAFAVANGADVAARTELLPPGVDTALMRPRPGTAGAEALTGIAAGIDPAKDDAAVFAGRLLWTKGIHYAVAALPLVLRQRPGFHLIIVGDGPMARPLRELIARLDAGDLAAARELLASDPELKADGAYGAVLPEMSPAEETAYIEAARENIGGRVHFTGHLNHEQLAPLYAAADISLAPSVFPEAFALVSIEALASGAVPLVTYQTGLRAAADVVADELGDASLRSLVPGHGLTRMLARSITEVLGRYPTRDEAFRMRLHQLADRMYSWERVASRYLELSPGGGKPAAER